MSGSYRMWMGIRVLIAESGLDGHGRGAKEVAGALRVRQPLPETAMTGVFVVAGSVREQDAGQLKRQGVAAVFQPGASPDEITEFIRSGVQQPA
ncbi:MAG: hypothetical protein ABSD56_13090 [Bryobacteraceae bacterium]